MSSQSLPQVPADFQPQTSTPVYTLAVFIRHVENTVVARAGNAELPEQVAPTVRDALKAIVSEAKNRLSQSEPANIWLEAPLVPKENESQFRVPLHL